MSQTIYNPYIKHFSYYQGPPPTPEDHRIALNYLKSRYKRS